MSQRTTKRAKITRLSDVQSESVRWLWPGRFALGKLSVLSSDPGLGKTTISMDIAARVTTGRAWPDLPDQPSGEPGGVVLLTAEDGIADTIRPRFDAANGNANRVAILEATELQDASTGETHTQSLSLSSDLPQLAEAMEAVAPCRLLIVDPITSYMGSADGHSNTEVRAFLRPLAELVRDHDVAAILISHLRKGEGKAIYRTLGSIGFVAVARTAWGIVADPNDESGERRLFLQQKNNVAANPGGLAYRITDDGRGGAHVVWEPGIVQETMDDLLQQQTTRQPERGNAARWLSDALAGGPQPSADLMTKASEAGISERTLRRAKETLGVTAMKAGGFGEDGGWYWALGSTGDE